MSCAPSGKPVAAKRAAAASILPSRWRTLPSRPFDHSDPASRRAYSRAFAYSPRWTNSSAHDRNPRFLDRGPVRRVALSRRVVEESRVAKHVRDAEVRLGVFRPAAKEVARFRVGFEEVPALGEWTISCCDASVRLGSSPSAFFEADANASPSSFGSFAELHPVVVAQGKRGPRGSVIGIQTHGALEHGERPLVGLLVARHGLAAQVEVVRLGVLRARSGICAGGRAAQEREETLAQVREICSRRAMRSSRRRSRNRARGAVRLRVHDLERHAELVALLLEVPGEDVGDTELRAARPGGPRRPLRISAWPRRAESPAWGCTRAGDHLVREGEAQVVRGRIRSQVLKREDGERGLAADRRRSAAPVRRPPASMATAASTQGRDGRLSSNAGLARAAPEPARPRLSSRSSQRRSRASGASGRFSGPQCSGSGGPGPFRGRC